MEITQIIAIAIMVLTLLAMVTGKVPIYLTALVGATTAALVYGIPLTTPLVEDGSTIVTLIRGAMHPVIIDMLGVLLFIGIMEKIGFLNTIIANIMEFGRRVGGGPGVATSGGIAAGIVGGLTGFTQPAITAVVTGPASIKLGVEPNESAGTHALAGILGNYGGFTHPTIVAVVATAGIGFGLINVIGIIVGLSAFIFSFVTLSRRIKNRGGIQADTMEEALSKKSTCTKGKALFSISLIPLVVGIALNFFLNFNRDWLYSFSQWLYNLNSDTGLFIIAAAIVLLLVAAYQSEKGSLRKAISPFVVLFTGFIVGYPIILVGIFSSIVVAVLAGIKLTEAEGIMMAGVHRISTPLFATISFLFMSAVMNAIGLIALASDTIGPAMNIAPIQILLLISAVTGFLTQSNGASAGVVVAFLIVAIDGGANPFAAAVAAAGGCAIMQYFLTGGPVAALSTVIPVIPGSELKAANKTQRPAILFALLVLFVITIPLSFL